MDSLFLPLTEAQRHINTVGNKVRLAVFRRDPDINFGITHAEPGQPRDQPFHGK